MKIIDEFIACVYCYSEVESYYMCCGEVHNEKAYILEDDSIVLESEYTSEDAEK